MGNSPAAEDKHSQPFVSLSFFFTAVWSRKGEGPVVHKMEAVLFLTLFFSPTGHLFKEVLIPTTLTYIYHFYFVHFCCGTVKKIFSWVSNISMSVQVSVAPHPYSINSFPR